VIHDQSGPQHSMFETVSTYRSSRGPHRVSSSGHNLCLNRHGPSLGHTRGRRAAPLEDIGGNSQIYVCRLISRRHDYIVTFRYLGSGALSYFRYFLGYNYFSGIYGAVVVLFSLCCWSILACILNSGGEMDYPNGPQPASRASHGVDTIFVTWFGRCSALCRLSSRFREPEEVRGDADRAGPNRTVISRIHPDVSRVELSC
jgi:hypothetical protein